MNLPLPWRSAASSDAWPPAPKVPSTTISPGCTASSVRTSCARTGTWSVAPGCKTFGNMLGAPFDFLHVLAPRGAIPDLEVIPHPCDHDLTAEAGVLEQSRRDHDPPLLVGLPLGGAREEEPLHHARLPAERVELREPRVDDLLPVVPSVGVEASVHAAGDHDAAGEGLSELGRQRES